MRLIDADALVEHMRKDPLFPLVDRYGVTGVIEAAPTIDPVKHGKWKETGDKGGRNYACDCCRFTFIMDIIIDTCMGKPMWNYCPNCGARMDGEEE